MGMDDRARVGRYVRPGGQEVILWDFWPVIDGVRKFEGRASPCSAPAGRFRLKRTGATLYFLWSPELHGGDFEELHNTEYGTEDTQFFTMVAESSGEKCGVDVRVQDVRIRNITAWTRTLQWLTAAVAVAGVAGGGFLGWRELRAKPSAPRLPRQKSGGDREILVMTADQAVERACPNCNKALIISAGAAGKKITCPVCNSVFVA
jgi:hypothetical protein